MHILLELIKNNQKTTEAVSYVMRGGKMVRILRGAGGKFGTGSTQARTSSSIGSREIKQQRGVQGGESLSGVSKAKRKLGTRRGTLTSRERKQFKQAGGGKQGSEYGKSQQILKQRSISSLKNNKMKVRRALNPKQMVYAARKSAGMSDTKLRSQVVSSLGPKQKAQYRRIRSIIHRISLGRKFRKKK